MTLKEDVSNILNNFDSTSSEKIVQTLNEIKSNFKSDLTSDYLQGKIKTVLSASDESEKKKLCKALLPYFDWYLQGN